ncbi:MAG: class A beta-lactamase-related serine hydrolase [Bacillota bacterium]|nr:class A beta-lactamase-related serine hydrolase [Bacillota bacterium]
MHLKGCLLSFLVLVLAAALAGCSSPNKKIMPAPEQENYEKLRGQVAAYIKDLPGTYTLYFKDLASEKEFGIEEDEPVPPASSIKLPVALYLYREIAAGNRNWEDRVRYEADTDYQEGAGILRYWAKNGDTYSLRTLATISIALSDNIAHNMLVRHLGEKNVMEFINKFAPRTTRPFGSASTTARDMGACVEEVLKFKRQHPELGTRLLDDLAHTIFHYGLPGKLPPDLLVAHKEGSIGGVATDVGVVLSRRPYILAVLAKDLPDEEEAFKHFSAISRIIYDYQQKLPPSPHLRGAAGAFSGISFGVGNLVAARAQPVQESLFFRRDPLPPLHHLPHKGFPFRLEPLLQPLRLVVETFIARLAVSCHRSNLLSRAKWFLRYSFSFRRFLKLALKLNE